LNAIAAARIMARARTGVGIGIVAIIAGFAFIKAPISTDFNGTARRTTIASDLVAVVAFFIAGFFGL
jgi:hypothetical protein